MNNPVSDENTNNSILNQINEGMRVCDSTGEEIGTVQHVFLSTVSTKADEQGRGPATAPDPNLREDTLVDNLAEAFIDNPLPEVLRERLLHNGYIRIDIHGLFASDRFALPDQIESVTEDCVRLRLTRDELIER